MIKATTLHELHLFCGGGDEREVKLCLSRGNDINMTDDDGWTPLHWSCYRRQPEMVQHEHFHLSVHPLGKESKLRTLFPF